MVDTIVREYERDRCERAVVSVMAGKCIGQTTGWFFQLKNMAKAA